MMDNYSLMNRSQYQYARLSPQRSVSDYAKEPVTSMASLVRGMNQKKITDYELSSMKEGLAVGGGLILATLATVSGVKKTMGIGQIAGFLAWVATLVYGPQVANSMVKLKTGINLNQDYTNTYGERYRLFKDPQYMPLHLLPEETLNGVGDRLNIPYGVDRERLIEDKIRQISVQTQTWWNLIAGATAPIVALGVTNAAFGSLMGGMSSLKSLYHEKIGFFWADSPSQATRHLDALIEEKLGQDVNSWMTRWEKRFEHKVVSSLSLDSLLKATDVVKMPEEKLMTQLIEHFVQLSEIPEKRQTLDSILNSLEVERQAVEEFERGILQALAQFRKALKGMENGKVEVDNFNKGRGQQILKELYQKKEKALSGIQHYEVMFKKMQRESLKKKEIRAFFEKPVIGEVNRLIRLGSIEEARILSGENAKLFGRMRHLLQDKNLGEASEFLGDSPRTHLLRSMKNFSSEKIWRHRMFACIGGGVILATFLFDMLFLGRSFGSSSSRRNG